MRKAALFASVALVAFAVAFADDKEKKDEFKAICPVSGKAALKDKTGEYRGALVYFCCENCPKAFAKDTAKFATKANHQLVATGQFVEVKCPLTGNKLNPDTKIEINGAAVTFCCNNCKGKVEKAKGDEQLELVFADKAFDKGFEIKKEEKKDEFKAICPVSGKAALKDKTGEYRDAVVYFCCENCPKAFAKDTAKFATKANLQLVVTGQFVEVKCPLTGNKLNPDTKIEISGAAVTFCCNNCKGKVEKAKGDEQLELVFTDKAFEKGFEKKKEEKKE